MNHIEREQDLNNRLSEANIKHRLAESFKHVAYGVSALFLSGTAFAVAVIHFL